MILIGGVLIGGITEKCLFNQEEEKIKEVIKGIGWINLDEKELKLETNLKWRGYLWRQRV